ncbi:YdeI/OmpD-associated family protein [Mucilaginibacter sp.]|uniref:YdeI/OmpD-associated family protein n=1 Tax=Mucilaginibacter sp. TaxID=1882438 RepID=UPI003D0A7A8E
MEQYDSRVDAYIEKSAEFAKPVLQYIRQVVHEASPLISETIKWGFPFFEYKGTICQMAAFKEHCAFGFWKASLLNDPEKVLKIGDQTAGSFSKITRIEDLPSKNILTDFILQAIAMNSEKSVKAPVKKVKEPLEKASLAIPDYFIDFLVDHPKAMEVFEKFSYSHKKEYVVWITEAKTDATRLKRMETAVEWMTEGKSRHWKYQTK